jgi:thiol-disulfide isomerase/thioredoxin
MKRPSWAQLRRWAAEVAIFLAIFVAIQLWQQRDVPSGTAPPTAGHLASGEPFNLAQWFAQHPDKKLVVLHFWADWCPICRSEQGSVTSLAADWPVITVAMHSGDAAAVNAYMTKHGLSWATLVDDTGRIAAEYGLKGVPAFFVIDREGRIRSVSTGYTTELGMRARLWLAMLD